MIMLNAYLYYLPYTTSVCVVSFLHYIYIYGLFIHLKATAEIAKFTNTSLKYVHTLMLISS